MHILFLIASLVLLFMVVRLLLRTPDVKRPTPGQLGSRRMVRCDYCGLHVPEEEAVRDGDRAYCSEDHRRLAMTPESTRE
ncbi:PP0621 family protein [Ectothiorhodospira mobilis]|jgi:uncharacterized protein|uniref:Preprotein translocase subunit YajC n=1 Tax=Ectothiorhodospira mobilis TaxID=195064 RepID=A0A1I4RCG9_ECTMO|nr:PP0621 family protein [Ectothiorhodospira mobilis]MCG5534505.1 hypothetical protein [Ectothiorhodospira mobilis]SFM49660.1 uncharacterized protein SAMN05421721_10777 [Ectothiorhodospira mobilis]